MKTRQTTMGKLGAAGVSALAVGTLLFFTAPCSAAVFTSSPESFTLTDSGTLTVTLPFGSFQEDGGLSIEFFGDGWRIELDIDLQLRDDDDPPDGTVDNHNTRTFFFELSHNGLLALSFNFGQFVNSPVTGQVLGFAGGGSTLTRTHPDGSIDTYFLEYKLLSVRKDLRAAPGDPAFMEIDYELTLTGQHTPAVPEPSTLTLLAIATLGMAGCAWRRRSAAHAR